MSYFRLGDSLRHVHRTRNDQEKPSFHGSFRQIQDATLYALYKKDQEHL